MCKAKGRDIYKYTVHIPGADLDPAHRPHIFPYIDLNLSTMSGPGGVVSDGGAAQAQNASVASVAPAQPQALPLAAKETSAMLSSGLAPKPLTTMSSSSSSSAATPHKSSGSESVSGAAVAVTASGQIDAVDAAIPTMKTAQTAPASSRIIASAPPPPPGPGLVPQQVLPPPAASKQVLSAPRSTNVVVAPQAEAQPNAQPNAQSNALGILRPSSQLCCTPAADDAATRNILATIFKRIAEKDTQVDL